MYCIYKSKIYYIKTLKMLLHVSILRSSSESTYYSLLRLHVKVVDMSLCLSAMWQHKLGLCMRCSSPNIHMFLQYLPNSYGVLVTTAAKLFTS